MKVQWQVTDALKQTGLMVLIAVVGFTVAFLILLWSRPPAVPHAIRTLMHNPQLVALEVAEA